MAESVAQPRDVPTAARPSHWALRETALLSAPQRPSSMDGLQPVHRTLLALLRPSSAAPTQIPPDADWPELGNVVDRLWLGARLAHRFASEQRVPLNLRRWWMQARLATAAHNLLLENEEAGLREELVRAGVDVIPLKGTSLARILYGDAAARPSNDIDLGVRSANVARAAGVLRGAGYEVRLPSALLARRAFLQGTDEHTSEVKCTRKVAGADVVVELHWKWLRLPESLVWSSLTQYDQAGVRTLCPEHYFLFLCAHVAGGGWAGLRWLCDIADFLTMFAGRMDGARCRELARQAALRRAVGITLVLIEDFFGIRYRALDSLASETARRTARRYCLRPFQPFLAGTPSGIHRARVAIQDNAWRRAQYLARLLRPTHLEWLNPNGDTRPAACAWAVRAGRLARMISGVSQ